MTMLDIAHKDRAHSPVGGSSAKRVMNCTASVELCAQYPNIESDFAAEGTAMHEAIDLILQGKTEKDTDVIGLTFNGYVIDQEMYDDGIAPALEYLDKLDEELGGIEYFNERRVLFPDISAPVRDADGNILRWEHDIAFGTVDIVGQAKDRTIVLDWKFGRGVAVEAERNEQLMYYAYAAAHTPPTDKFFSKDKPIEVFIVQPRVMDGEPFTRWMTTMLQLEAFAADLRRAVGIAYTEEATFKLGPWCKFCNAKTGCDLYNGIIGDAADLVDANGVNPVEEDIRRWLPYADDLIKFGDLVKQRAHAMMEEGISFEEQGYKLVNKRVTRNWVDEDKTLKYFARMKLPAEQRYVKKIISPAQAEKALKPFGVSAIPKDLIDAKSSGTTLAPLEDKRPAVLAGGALKELAARLAAQTG